MPANNQAFVRRLKRDVLSKGNLNLAHEIQIPAVWSRVLFLLLLAALLGARPIPVSAATPDPVLEWNAIMNDTVIAAKTTPLFTGRVTALVAASVFDAVNGIEERYQPIHVTTEAPQHASQRAAAVQAAYAMLIKLYPAQSVSLKIRRDASMAAIASGPSAESHESIKAGSDWGQAVADSISDWRSTDGITPTPPPFLGVLGIVGTSAAVGVWRPTTPGNASGAGPQFATMTPWILSRPAQFRPAPPPALTSPEYAADYNETRTMGAFSGSLRSADQSELALFWAGNTPLFWNRITSQLAAAQFSTVLENAHLFALLNLAMADAAIACWDAKYRYVFWRPITAIHDDASTDPDPTWSPWLNYFPTGTPAHPEYLSGHSTVSGAAAFILETTFGDNTSFTINSDTRPGSRSFTSFSGAVAEIADARVFGGIHFRTSCVRGNEIGRVVADYVVAHAMRPGHDRDEDRQ
jgi:hypothetical protein